MSRTARIVVGALAVLLLAFIVIQFIPGPVRANPPVVSHIAWDSPQTEQLVRAACYDCHSNETNWPWYTQIAPVSWLTGKDVNEGREALNLSLKTADEVAPEEMVEQIEDGEMPPRIYLVMHPEANLNADQKAQLERGLQASLHGTETNESGEGGERGESGE